MRVTVRGSWACALEGGHQVEKETSLTWYIKFMTGTARGEMVGTGPQVGTVLPGHQHALPGYLPLLFGCVRSPLFGGELRGNAPKGQRNRRIHCPLNSHGRPQHCCECRVQPAGAIAEGEWVCGRGCQR
ncbi:unnamed protein product, partial [Symbiodinium sp. CCMP2592]